MRILVVGDNVMMERTLPRALGGLKNIAVVCQKASRLVKSTSLEEPELRL